MLAGLAFAAFAGSFLMTPIVARGAAGSFITTTPPFRPLAAPSAAAVVLPRRDPFAGGEAPRAIASAPLRAVSGPPLEPLASASFPSIPAALRPLPPNAGAANAPPPFAPPMPSAPFTSPGLPAPTARVTAVITGVHPFALVDEAGTTRLVTIGDRIAGEAIAAISAAGIRLAHGTILTVTPVTPSAPATTFTPVAPVVPVTHMAPPSRSDSGGR